MANHEQEIKRLDKQFKKIKLGTAAAIFATGIGTVGLAYTTHELDAIAKEPPKLEDINRLKAMENNSELLSVGGGIGTAIWLTALGLNRRKKEFYQIQNKGC